eukprot:PITA_33223
MAKHLRMSIIILWLALALSALSICRAVVGDIATQAFFLAEFYLKLLVAAQERPSANTVTSLMRPVHSLDLVQLGHPMTTKEKLLLSSPTLLTTLPVDLCYVEEIEKSVHCDPSKTQYPSAPGQQYYGRGPLQLTGNTNYGGAGKYLDVNLLNNPGILAQDGLTSWKSALWFWNVNSYCHTAITSDQGFGATIQAINGALDCIGKATDKVNDRINHYTNYCSQFGVNPGNNLQC